MSMPELTMPKKLLALTMTASALALVGCGSSNDNAQVNNTGKLTVAVTDGPIDDAVAVVVEFTGVSVKPAAGEALEFMFDEARSIDLLQLQGSASADLLSDVTVPAGAYEWMRLHVVAAEDNVMDSFIEFDNGTSLELRIPSGAQSGLKLVRGFTVPAGGTADFTVDFDLRKSITLPGGMTSATLKPALRLVDNVQVGSIAGTVDENLVLSACADPASDDGAVYVYAGADVTPADVQGAATDPVVSALVSVEEGQYRYELGFLTEGDYTVAYTCNASDDDPEAVDALTFSAAVTVPVVAGLPTALDIAAPTEQVSVE